MVYTDRKELNSKHFIMSILATSVAALCILKISGLTATIVVIIYCILLGLTILGIFEQIFKSEAVGMRLGMALDPKTGKVSLDMGRYDQFIETYEHRFSNIWFWLDIPVTMAWVIIFLAGGFSTVAYISIAVYMGLEIGRYEVYKAIKKNKDGWGAAMYISEVRDFVKKKEENNE